MRKVVDRHDGYLVKTTGDGILAAFGKASDAAGAAVAIQRELRAGDWVEAEELRVRIGLHTGSAQFREDDYFGPAVNRAARLMALGHGGQVLLSASTADLLKDDLSKQMALLDLGNHQLKDLTRPEHVFQLTHPDLDAEFPPLASLDQLPHNLPRQLTSFIGREQELKRVQELLTETSLLTLTGVGGSGKTRLALQAVAELFEGYSDGVWLVELGRLSDPDRVPQAVAEALGVRESPNRSLTDVLCRHLERKQLLLLIDNCEHLLRACGELVERLLRSCTELKVLATSREGLGIWGEQTYPVPSLDRPDLKEESTVDELARYETIRLFIDRVAAVRPDFALMDENAAAVATICDRLDGIPLAIELAAARARALPVDEIARRLEDRFRLLTGGSRTALPRHQTLEATMDWSYELLGNEEKWLLQRLAVFSGGLTLEAAEHVGSSSGMATADVLDLLTTLVDKSMVIFSDQEPVRRYHLLETVRQYAWKKLFEGEGAEEVRDAHLAYCLELAEEVQPHLGFFLPQAETSRWLDRLGLEYENFQTALGWSLEGHHGGDQGLRLAYLLHWFWYARGYFSRERALLQRLLNADVEVAEPIRAYGLLTEGYLACWQGDFEAAVTPLTEAHDRLNKMADADATTFALHGLGYAALGSGDIDLAHARFREALSQAQALEDPWLVPLAQHFLGQTEVYLGHRHRATERFQACLSALRDAGGNFQGEAFTHFHLGHVAQLNGSLLDAKENYRECLRLLMQISPNRGRDLIYPFEGLAAVAARQEDAWRAATLFGVSKSLRESLGFSLEAPLQAEHDRYVSEVMNSLGEEAWDRAQTQAGSMGLSQALDLALQE